MKRKALSITLLVALLVLAACAPKTIVVEKEVTTEVEKVVKETVVVEKEVVTEVEKVVKETVVVEKQVVPSPTPPSYNEPPMLAEMVQAGDLPSVLERMPSTPVVIQPYQGIIGTYGGTLRSWNRSISGWWLLRHFKYDKLVRLNPYYGPNRSFIFQPDIADWWEVSDDNREFTFHIREGIKWSDGEPLTSEDMRFYWEDVMLNDEVRAIVGVREFPGTIEVIDDYTFKVVFEDPLGTFLFDQAQGRWAEPRWLEFPAHYMKQFHPDYASEADLEDAVKESGFESWTQLFNDRRQWWTNPDVPQVSAWVLEEEPDETGLQIYARNPYYYKVDTEGNQLPYIDYWHVQKLDIDVALMKTMQGEIDYHFMTWRVTQFPTIKQGEVQGHYKAGPEFNFKRSEGCLFINQTTEDEVLREIFQDIRFRQAVSHSLNRQEMVDLVYHGAAEPGNLCVGDYVIFNKPEWCGKYAEYDPDKANELLDEMGLEWDASGEYRLRPDGKPLEVLFLYPTYRAGFADAYQLIAEYAGEIGIKVVLKAQEGSVWNQEAGSNASQWSTGSNRFDLASANTMVGFTGYNYGYEWRRWYYSDGEEGWEPPEYLKTAFEYLREGENANTIDERAEAYAKAMDIFVDNLWIICFMGHDKRPSTIHNRLRNFSTEMENIVNPQVLSYPGALRYPEQWWIDPDWSP